MLIEPHQMRWIEKHIIEADIPFVVIGGVAVKFYLPAREISDVDLFVGSDPATIERLVANIPRLAADPTATARLLNPMIGHFSVGGEYRIDVLTFAPSLMMVEALEASEVCEIAGVPIPFLGRQMLIEHKRAVGDPKDLEDAMLLQALDAI